MRITITQEQLNQVLQLIENARISNNFTYNNIV